MTPSRMNRRSFLKASASAAAALSAFGVPAVNALGANEKLNIGVIGVGRRGRTLARKVNKLGQNVVALCDVASFRLDVAIADAAKAGESKPALYKDHRQLLEHKGLDGVIIASPDHWHHDMLQDAMQAGKDTYIEKPLAMTIEEGRSMVQAVRATKQIVQVGNQRHSGPHWAHCRDYIQSSDFGQLVWARVWDCRNWTKNDPFAPPKDFNKVNEIDWKRFLGKAPPRAFDMHRFFSWRWYWDYAGGLMTDIGAHQLDILQWLSGQEKGPKSVVANGGNYYYKHWETPDVLHGVWDYGTFSATFDVEFINDHEGVGAAFYGTKRTIWADATKEIRVYDAAEKPDPNRKPLESWPVVYEGPAHMHNWFDCCKSRKEPNSPIELGCRVFTTAHLGNLAYRSGKKIFWDPVKEEMGKSG